jgi:hypothetical protein
MASTNRESSSSGTPPSRQLDLLRDATTRAELALQRLEHDAEVDAAVLARRLEALDTEQRQTAHKLDDEYRHEHFGKSPPAW